jgi:biopolymer transport protein TolR
MAFRLGDDEEGGLLGDINVTPLVDVMLVLLILFMVTAPMLQQGFEVNLPDASAKNLKSPPQEPLVLAIRKDGLVYLGREPIQPARLVDRLRGLLRGRGDDTVYLRGDREVPYGKVIELLDILQAAGIVKVALITEGVEPTGSRSAR